MTSQPAANQESRDALASLRINRGLESKRAGGRWWKVPIVLALLGGGGWYGYQWAETSGMLSGQSGWVPEIMQNRAEVRLESVNVQKGRSADAVVVATGYLRSHRQARIGARAAGIINVVAFEEGNKVTKGELLAELEHKDMEASLVASAASVARSKSLLAEQEIAIEKARVEQDRNENLWKSRSISESEYDQAKFAFRTALARKNSMESDIALAEAQQKQTAQLMENMFIRAPFDGTVISKDAEVGESIMPGGMGGVSGRGSVATIADLEHLQIECDVQEDFISRVSEGQETDISVDAVPDKKYHGKVRKIIPMGDRARATIKVQVDITDADGLLFPEMAGTVFFLPTKQDLEVSDEPRIFCPASAIEVDEHGDQKVWIVDDEKRAQSKSVKAGKDNNGKVEITNGLTGNERVVVNPKDMKDGTPVKVVD